jgi:hypothetical protein
MALMVNDRAVKSHCAVLECQNQGVLLKKGFFPNKAF